jgi:hypothetical protein
VKKHNSLPDRTLRPVFGIIFVEMSNSNISFAGYSCESGETCSCIRLNIKLYDENGLKLVVG